MHLARVIDRFLTYNNLSLLLIRKSLEVLKNKQNQKFKISQFILVMEDIRYLSEHNLTLIKFT
jgi:hypothetical protein